MEKPIASFDIDMTLLDHKTWEIPASALDALDRLRDRYRIVLSTGRDMDSAAGKELLLKIRPEAIIHLNGTKITAGETLVYEHLFDKKLLSRLLAFVASTPYSVGATLDETDYFVNPCAVTAHDIKSWKDSWRSFGDPEKLLQMKVHTLSYLGDEAGAKIIENRFPQLKFYLFFEKRGADVVEKAYSKGVGLKRLCRHYGCDIRDSIAFGDSMNDFDILKAAGIGVAMGNAIDELKQAADYVTTSIDQDGIWNACRHLKLF